MEKLQELSQSITESDNAYYQNIYESLVSAGMKSGMTRESSEDTARKSMEEIAKRREFVIVDKENRIIVDGRQKENRRLERSPDVEKMYDFLRDVSASVSWEDAKAILEKAEEIVTSTKKEKSDRGLMISELVDNEVYSCRVSGWNVLVLNKTLRKGLVYSNTGYTEIVIHDGQLRVATTGCAPFA